MVGVAKGAHGKKWVRDWSKPIIHITYHTPTLQLHLMCQKCHFNTCTCTWVFKNLPTLPPFRALAPPPPPLKNPGYASGHMGANCSSNEAEGGGGWPDNFCFLVSPIKSHLFCEWNCTTRWCALPIFSQEQEEAKKFRLIQGMLDWDSVQFYSI